MGVDNVLALSVSTAPEHPRGMAGIACDTTASDPERSRNTANEDRCLEEICTRRSPVLQFAASCFSQPNRNAYTSGDVLLIVASYYTVIECDQDLLRASSGNIAMDIAAYSPKSQLLRSSAHEKSIRCPGRLRSASTRDAHALLVRGLRVAADVCEGRKAICRAASFVVLSCDDFRPGSRLYCLNWGAPARCRAGSSDALYCMTVPVLPVHYSCGDHLKIDPYSGFLTTLRPSQVDYRQHRACYMGVNDIACRGRVQATVAWEHDRTPRSLVFCTIGREHSLFYGKGTVETFPTDPFPGALRRRRKSGKARAAQF
ncbi:hypothetical protein EVG20_g8096 [Dentipellis fragilis]|uniref:Uncharacterized protein n=1 Tax=Dentipellis fragilis TaxID=205917 RepID=A0A4Y9YAI7_9AGAM|nr:hypothetical protein EVG20_g8096 [Dentipellis fragilis]